MSRVILITPSPQDLGPVHRVGRDAWSGNVATLRCPEPRCGRLVYVNNRSRVALHAPHGQEWDCCMSGAEVVDRAGPGT